MRIAKMIFSKKVAAKLFLKHGLSTLDIQEISVLATDDEMHWSLSEKHGGKLEVKTESFDGKTIFIALRPINIDLGIWECVTAFFPTNKRYNNE